MKCRRWYLRFIQQCWWWCLCNSFQQGIIYDKRGQCTLDATYTMRKNVEPVDLANYIKRDKLVSITEISKTSWMSSNFSTLFSRELMMSSPCIGISSMRRKLFSGSQYQRKVPGSIKEWGPCRWYHHPTKEQTAHVSERKTIWWLPVIGVWNKLFFNWIKGDVILTVIIKYCFYI